MAPSRQLFLGRKEVEFSSQKRMVRGRPSEWKTSFAKMQCSPNSLSNAPNAFGFDFVCFVPSLPGFGEGFVADVL